jgi:hypothetical protein
MGYMLTADISRMILSGQKEIFTENFNSYPIEYPAFTTAKNATKKTETYDSMGNLKAAEEKAEGGPITYGSVSQAYQTSITNKVIANGFAHTMESIRYDLYGVVNSVKAKELARTMREYEEALAIYWFDNAITVNLTDGQPLGSLTHPLVDSASVNVTLATAATIADPDNHKTMINMFYDFKNHAGGPMVCRPTDGLTHYANQLTVEEVYRSINKANEFSNTKNTLPSVNWHYSTYISSKTAYAMWDNRFDHVCVQWFAKTEMDQDQDKISTKNFYMNSLAMYNTGAMPNVGFVYNAGA